MTTTIFIIFCCCFLHVFADFHLQGCLAKFKQKSFWENEIQGLFCKSLKDTRYKYDYICALFIHAFEWSFITFFPLLFVSNLSIYIITVIVNTMDHAYIDNLKANKLKINLIEDQGFHLFQIIVTVILVNFF